MSTPPPDPIIVTPSVLREWPLPAAGDSKYGRGQVLVIGGAARTPGAAMLASVAALRVGAGRLTIALAESVAPHVAVAIPECGVVPLDETPGGHVAGASIRSAFDDIATADTLLIGPGLDDADEAIELLRALPELVSDEATVVLDAFALGVLPQVPEVVEALTERLVLTPNKSEAGRLLGRDIDDLDADAAELASRYRCVVSCFGTVASHDGRVWTTGSGGTGLATSGSGDVLAGGIAGLTARGAALEQATVWATHVHGAAGDRLAVQVGPLGYLASELLGELPRVLVEVAA